jgi:putative transposase
VELVDRRTEARWLWEHYLVSRRRVCGLMVLAESSYRYVSRRDDEPLRLRLLAAAREKPRWGYRRLQIVLDERGEHVNHKRIYRVYREAGLMIRRKARKRLRREGSARPALDGPNQEWALDFVHDAAASGRKFRALSVVDPYTRECLALEVDTSMGSRRVTRVLEGVIAERGAPQAIRSDNVLTQECWEVVRTKISRASDFQARLQCKSKWLPPTTGMALHHSDTRSAEVRGLLCT